MRARREFIINTAILGLTVAGTRAARAETCRTAPLTRERFRRYLDLFVSLDPAVVEFFSDDVVFRIGDRQEIKTPQNILEVYRRRLRNVRESSEILFFCSDSTGLAAELRTEYRCFRDEDDPSIFGRPLKKGEVRRSLGIALYTVENGKITSMHGAPQTISDWHMEADAASEQSPRTK